MTATSSFKMLAERAERLRALHHAPEPLILPNAWDAASARLVQDAGFPAVATTSSGVAASLGWPDGEQMPLDEVFGAVARIARVLDVPLTADLEAGYGLDAAALVQRMLEAGAVGCNLEDTDHAAGKVLRDPHAQAEWLSSVKQAGRSAGVDIVLNARVDIFVRRHTETDTDIQEAVQRARLYLEAGADCVYPILCHQESTVTALVQSIQGPINIFALPDLPPAAHLAELGAKRISFAGRLQRAAMAQLQRSLQAITAGQTLDS
jgi:2-methylisocitrate lyase-like PEP mutase family enzyme